MVSDTQQKPAPCKRFVKLGLDASIIAAAHMFFGKETTENTPTKHTISNRTQGGSPTFFYRVVKEFIQTYVVDGTLNGNHFNDIQALQERETAQTKQPIPPNDRYHCRFPGCSSSLNMMESTERGMNCLITPTHHSQETGTH